MGQGRWPRDSAWLAWGMERQLAWEPELANGRCLWGMGRMEDSSCHPAPLSNHTLTEDEEDDMINSITPTHNPTFRAMEKDIDERHRR